MSATVTTAIDHAAIAINAQLVTAHAGRLIRIYLTYGKGTAAAAQRAADYIQRMCAPIDADLMAQIARGLLAEAEREAEAQRMARS